jgi:hypothetical protein
VRSSKAWDMMINMNRHPAVPLPMTNGNFIRNSRSFVQSSSFSGAVPFFSGPMGDGNLGTICCWPLWSHRWLWERFCRWLSCCNIARPWILPAPFPFCGDLCLLDAPRQFNSHSRYLRDGV